MSRFVVHHLVSGPLGMNSGITAHSFSRASARERGRKISVYSFRRGEGTTSEFGERMLGYELKVFLPATQFAEAQTLKLWAEGMAWTEDTDARRPHRDRDQDGFARTHQLLWPSKAHADRHRHRVLHVDPATLHERLRVAPAPIELEDDPCEVCAGSGRRPTDDPLAAVTAERDALRAEVDRLRGALEVFVGLADRGAAADPAAGPDALKTAVGLVARALERPTAPPPDSPGSGPALPDARPAARPVLLAPGSGPALPDARPAARPVLLAPDPRPALPDDR
jgi:hypothetical protein